MVLQYESIFCMMEFQGCWEMAQNENIMYYEIIQIEMLLIY